MTWPPGHTLVQNWSRRHRILYAYCIAMQHYKRLEICVGVIEAYVHVRLLYSNSLVPRQLPEFQFFNRKAWYVTSRMLHQTWVRHTAKMFYMWSHPRTYITIARVAWQRLVVTRLDWTTCSCYVSGLAFISIVHALPYILCTARIDFLSARKRERNWRCKSVNYSYKQQLLVNTQPSNQENGAT